MSGDPGVAVIYRQERRIEQESVTTHHLSMMGLLALEILMRRLPVQVWQKQFLILLIAILPDEEFLAVFRKSDQFPISQNNSLGVLPYLGKSFVISFQLSIHTLDTESGDYNNILHFSIGGDKEIYGDRTPAIWIVEGRAFQLASAINGNANYDPEINFEFETEKWYNFELSQLINDDAGVSSSIISYLKSIIKLFSMSMFFHSK